MTQTELFSPGTLAGSLPTIIKRERNTLVIPEGVHTIPATHGMHRFPGKFIPNIPRYFIREVLPACDARVVYDPFCGSGTTLVEAALEGRPFIGSDIDPLAVLIASAKVAPLPEKSLDRLASFWKQHDFNRPSPDHVPNVPNLSHWFKERAIAQLSSIKAACLTLPPKERAFSLVVFSSIIRRVSNADDQTQKTYVSGTLHKVPPPPSTLFPVFLDRAVTGMREFVALLPGRPTGSIFRDDVRTTEVGQPFDDILTSPPYIDSIDYIYNQMLEYFWLLPELGIADYDEFRRLRRQPMGFRRDSTDDESLAAHLGAEATTFAKIVRRIAKKSAKEGAAVSCFFSDYVSHLRRVERSQPSGGYYISVVGNSNIRGVVVPTADILVALHESSGYTLVDRFEYEIRRHYMKFPRRSNSGTIKRDFILVFQHC